MYSVEKLPKFIKPQPAKHNRLEKRPQSPNPVLHNKSFEKLKRYTENNNNEQSSFISKEASKRKTLAIVTLNIEDESEKLIIYEGEDIYELATNIAKKYDLNEEFIDYITENINTQIKTHQMIKKKAVSPFSKPIISNEFQQKESLTPKFQRAPNFDHLNSSKSIEKIVKLPRQKTTSPLNRSQINEGNKKNYEENQLCLDNHKFKNFDGKPEQKPIRKHKENNLDVSKFATNQVHKYKNNEIHLDNSNFLSTNSKFISSQSNESFNESIRHIKQTASKEKKLALSPGGSKNKNLKQTVLVSKDLKIIENNIIFLPPAYLSTKNNDSKKVTKTNKLKKKNNQNKPNNDKIGTNDRFIEKDLNFSDRFLTDLQEIFVALDEDQDGYISSKSIDLMKLDPRVLEILQNILIEMDEKHDFLNFASFLNKIEEHHLEIKIHDFFKENEKNPKITNFSPKHSSQFSFGDFNQLLLNKK